VNLLDACWTCPVDIGVFTYSYTGTLLIRNGPNELPSSVRNLTETYIPTNSPIVLRCPLKKNLLSLLSLTVIVVLALVTASAQVPASNRVIVVLEENHGYAQTIGSSSMPYLNSLVAKGGLATNYYADAHPSIGNYFMFTSGQLVSTNDAFSGQITQNNLFRALIAAGKSWKSYAESLPQAGYTGGDAFPYLKHHNPAAYVQDVIGSSAQVQNIVPFTQFASDLSGGTLPNLSIVIPNAQHDAHDCPVSGQACTDADKLAAADNWLKSLVDPLLQTSDFASGGNGVVMVVWDEALNSDSANGGGKVGFTIVGPNVKVGYTSSTFFQHEALLRLISTALGLNSLPGASAAANDSAEFFVGASNVVPPVSVSRSSLFFGSSTVGSTSTAKQITVQNNTSQSLTFGSFSIDADFKQTNTCEGRTLAPAGTCAVGVSFAPVAAGMRSGVLAISNGGSNISVYLAGNASAQPSPTPTPAVWRINAGGLAYTDSNGNSWSADQNSNTGTTFSTTSNIAGTSDPTLFKSQRWDPLAPPELVYSLPVPNGTYTVNLGFAEIYTGNMKVGARVFNVTLQGNVVFPSLDVYAAAGGNTALIKSAVVDVTNGTLTIGLQRQIENPMISSIEVIAQSASTNNPPTAVASATPASGTAPLQVSFSSSGSADSDGAITGYSWDFGDGSTSTLANPTHVYNTAGSYTATLTVTDNGGAQGTATAAVTANTPSNLPATYRINAGGPLYLDSNGQIWEADKGYNTGNPFNTSPASINGSNDPALFKTQRWNSSTNSTPLQYSLNVPNGTYTVNLYFAETYIPNQKVGARVFNIALEGSTVFSNLDVYAMAGANTQLVESAPVTVNDGVLTIGFLPVVQNPFVNAIEVLSQNPASSLNSAINHIVWFVQENRSFDSYFGMMGAYRSARGLTGGFDALPLTASLLNGPSGKFVSPYPYQTVCNDILSAGWNSGHTSVDGGKMDLFMKQNYLGAANDPNYTRPMGYFDQNDLNYYYPLAFTFATSDRFFSSVLGPTTPNRMYMFSGTSWGNTQDTVPVPAGGFTQPTIFDRLTAAGISWRMYYYDTSHILLKSYSTYGSYSKNVFPISQYFIDVQNESTFPQFVFIERGGSVDEHTGGDVNYGVQNTQKYISALMNSPVWADSAFILSFDEGGGMYDHVPPVPMPQPDQIQPILQPGDFQASFDQSGFRVPFFILSPWVRPHFVSHVARDHTSVLKLIETRFGLQPLTQRDAQADNMLEFFDFSTPQMLLPPPFPKQNAIHGCNYSLEKAPGF
jgi:phospholipase C/PKD repeat protein